MWYLIIMFSIQAPLATIEFSDRNACERAGELFAKGNALSMRPNF